MGVDLAVSIAWKKRSLVKKIKDSHERITQCTAMQTASAFALIRLGNISDSRRLGTGPAPRENINTNLH